MPPSSLYEKLDKRVLILEKQLLSFHTNKSLLPRNQDKLRAFKLLVHAEIESFIENVVLTVWTKCDTEWKNNKKVAPSLRFLTLFSTSKYDANDNQVSRDDRITQILGSFKKAISNNNGIKRKNILQLIVPLGIEYSVIDQTWLATIDSYGSSRGQVAHNSYSTLHPLDRDVELKNLNLVLKGIRVIDNKINSLLTSRRKPF
jgi:hypothetical protein